MVGPGQHPGVVDEGGQSAVAAVPLHGKPGDAGIPRADDGSGDAGILLLTCPTRSCTSPGQSHPSGTSISTAGRRLRAATTPVGDPSPR